MFTRLKSYLTREINKTIEMISRSRERVMLLENANVSLKDQAAQDRKTDAYIKRLESLEARRQEIRDAEILIASLKERLKESEAENKIIRNKLKKILRKLG